MLRRLQASNLASHLALELCPAWSSGELVIQRLNLAFETPSGPSCLAVLGPACPGFPNIAEDRNAC